jgi:hypothetical protein
MSERLVTLPQDEVMNKIDYRQKISQILFDQRPVEKLHQTAQEVEYHLDSNTALKLKLQLSNPNEKESAIYELMYRCIPTLDNTVQKMTRLGLPNDEIVQFGFFQLDQLIQSWDPNNNYLKKYLGLLIPERFEEFIASYYQIGVKLFPLIPIYFSSVEEFRLNHLNTPKPEDWFELHTIIVENIKTSSATKNNPERYKKHLIRIIQHLDQKALSLNQQSENSLKEQLNNQLLKTQIDNALDSSGSTEIELIESLYNLDYSGQKTLSNTAKKLSSVEQRIVQLQEKAYIKQHPSRIISLIDFYS